jgi:hypothetical protein
VGSRQPAKEGRASQATITPEFAAWNEKARQRKPGLEVLIGI